MRVALVLLSKALLAASELPTVVEGESNALTLRRLIFRTHDPYANLTLRPYSADNGAGGAFVIEDLEHGLGEAQIVGQLRKAQWFRGVRFSELQALCRRGTQRLFARYSTILREGSEGGGTLFVLLSGQVKCASAIHELNGRVLGEGAAFGEGGLLPGGRRDATVTALEDCCLLQFTHEDVARLSSGESLLHDVRARRSHLTSPRACRAQCPPLERLHRACVLQVRVHCVAGLLAKLPVFRSLSRPQREALAAHAQLVDVGAGEALFAAGDVADALYLVVDGRVRLTRAAEAEAEEEGRGAGGGGARGGRSCTDEERPWVGEGAVASAGGGSPGRHDVGALALEPCRLIALRGAAALEAVLEAVPKFSQICAAAAPPAAAGTSSTARMLRAAART